MKKTLIAVMAVLALVACKSDDTKGYHPQDSSSTETPLPKDDQLAVTTNIGVKIYGTAGSDVSYRNSIISRFNNVRSEYDPKNTLICVVTSEALKAHELTFDDYKDLCRCYEKGGIIFLTTPDFDTFNLEFQFQMSLAYFYRMIDTYGLEYDGGPIELGDLGDTFFNINEVSKERLKDNVMFDGLGFSKYGIFFCDDIDNFSIYKSDTLDSDGNETKAEVPARKINGYEYGCYADSAVDWMEKMLLKTKVTLQEAMEAYTVSYSHSIYAYSFTSQETETYSNVVAETFRIYVAHDVNSHKDYYQIDQEANFYSGLVNPVPNYEDQYNWWYTSSPKETWYIRHFSEWKSKLTLKFDGCKPKVIAAKPEAENSSTEYSTSIYNGTMSSQSNGVSVGGSWSIADPFGISGSYSHTWESGTTYECQVGTACSKKDIEILKHTTFDNGIPSVEWHYMGNRARGIYENGDSGNLGWQVGSLQISDMNQVNSILYEVPGATSGTATLYVDEQIWYRTMYDQSHNKDLSWKGCCASYNYNFKLPKPFRSKQHWLLTFEQFGDVPVSQRMAFEQFIENKLVPGGSSFDMRDVDDSSTNAAQGVLNLFMDDFRHLENSLKQMGYTGKFVFALQNADGKKLTASYTIY